MTRRLLTTLTCLATLALAGCDDVLLFDVAPDGRIVAAVDAHGRVAAVADGAELRHLVRLDPDSGAVDLLTTSRAVSWPRACAGGAVFVEGRRRLVLVAADGTERRLFETDLQLLQPTPSPTGTKVAVLEAARPGAPGLLHVIDLETGATGVPLDGALLGYAWTGEDLVVGRLMAADAGATAYEGGEGEVLLLRDERQVQLERCALPGVTWFSATRTGAVAALPAPGRLGLSRVGLGPEGGVTAGEPTASLDMWPSVDAAGRVLFTRARPDRPTLEGELRATTLDALGASTRVPTPGPVVSPRWLRGDRVAYLSSDDRLVTQTLDGAGVVDWTARLRDAAAAAGGAK